MLCIWFFFTPPVLTLNLVKTLREGGGGQKIRKPCGRHSLIYIKLRHEGYTRSTPDCDAKQPTKRCGDTMTRGRLPSRKSSAMNNSKSQVAENSGRPPLYPASLVLHVSAHVGHNGIPFTFITSFWEVR